jgi:hypothetical protein
VRPIIKDHLEMATVNINAPDAPDGRKRFLDYFDPLPPEAAERRRQKYHSTTDDDEITALTYKKKKPKAPHFNSVTD